MWPSILSWQLDRVQPTGADTAAPQSPLLSLSCVGKSGNAPPGGCSRNAELAAEQGRSSLSHHQLAAGCEHASSTKRLGCRGKPLKRETKKVMQRRDWAGTQFLRVVPHVTVSPPAKVFSSAHPAHLLLRLQRRSRSIFFISFFVSLFPHD